MKLKIQNPFTKPTEDELSFALNHYDAETLEELFGMIEGPFLALWPEEQIPHSSKENPLMWEDVEF
jgi:uncharacterized membrane protein